MSLTLALSVFIAGITGLFYLDRDESFHTSKLLWMPLIWLSIAGSRSPFAWFGMGVPEEVPGQLPEGSWPDQLLAGSLIIFGLLVLILRGKEVMNLLKANWPIMIYFLFCLISLTWSDFAGWGLKRWVRSLGDLIMVLIVFTDPQPTAAFKRLFSRVGFVLLPASVLLIRYYPSLGTAWDPWGEGQTFVGVTTNKNALGDLVYLIGLGALWQILSLVPDKLKPNRRRRLLAQGTLLGFGIYLLSIAHCATANACFILGAGLMLILALPLFRRIPARVHVFLLTLALLGGVGYLIGAKTVITEALGRKEDLTGRTEIWKIVTEMAPNPIGGAGFETFWVGPRVAKAYSLIGGITRTNEAHNGYIETYLNLGLLGVGLIVLILANGYLKAVAAFRRDPALGGLLVAYVVTAASFNISEAGFRMLSLEWFFLLLSIVAASRVINIPEPAPDSGQEPAHPAGPRWVTRMSPDPVRFRGRVDRDDAREAMIRRYDHKGPRTKEVIVVSRKVND